MTSQNIVMPQLGESVVEGTILQWLVKPGDRVEPGTVLLEVETDKADAEVPSTASGFVSRLLVEEGVTVAVGTALIELVSDASAVASAESASPPAADAPPAPAATPAPPPASAPAADKGAAAPVIDAPAPSMPATASMSPGDREPATTIRHTNGSSGAAPQSPAAGQVAPSVRRSVTPQAGAPGVASDHNRPWNVGGIIAAPTSTAVVSLPLAQREIPAPPPIPADMKRSTSPSQRLTATDSAGAKADGAPSGPLGTPAGMKAFRPPVVEAGPDDRVIPFNRRRTIISEHMVYSKHVSPHVPCFAEVDMTPVVELRRAHKDALAKDGVSLTILAFLMKATVDALREFPSLNAVVGDGELIERAHVNLGVAVETDGGLVVPVIRDADKMNVAELASAVQAIAVKARDKKITPDDLSGGTFTVSNPGRRGNLFGAAIINQPQVGIVRMGEIVRRPVVRVIDGDEAISIRSMMYLSLSYDHRVIDGVTGNGFLYRIRELLEAAAFEVGTAERA